MEIVYCGAFRLPDMDAAAPRVLNNARAMKSCGHTISFISWGGRYRGADLCQDGKYRIEGMEYVITNEIDFTGNFLFRLIQIFHRGKRTLQLLNNMQKKPDVIIMYNADYKWTKTLLTYCSRNKIKLVNDITEWYDRSDLHFYDRLPYYFNMTHTQKKVKNKIVISSYLSNYYKESNNIVIPPLCDSSEKKWGGVFSSAMVDPFDGVTLIYAGNPGKKDAVHYVVNAVQQLVVRGSAIRFLILGTTRESYLSRYANMLHTNELHKNIIFLGRVSQEDIPSYYHQADFMVLLRDQTRKSNAGFPTKFSESFTSGTPVIANLTSDLRMYLKDGETGFVVGESSEESVYKVLKEKVLTLNHREIENMKSKVKTAAKQLDYHAYVDSLRDYMCNLEYLNM